MAIHIVNEANRCLNCKKPMCQQGCPVHTPIPQVIQLFKENRLMEAGEILFNNNPMSAVCSIVCNHEKQCAGNCIHQVAQKGFPLEQDEGADLPVEAEDEFHARAEGQEGRCDRLRPRGHDGRHHAGYAGISRDHL